MTETISGPVASETSAAGRAVATAAVPRAADVAVEVLAEGGNAYDAAVAASLVETVWLPMKCGLAGDVVALVREPDGRIETLVSIGPGGAAFSAGAGLTVTGPRSVGVPGAPDGYSALTARGRLGLERLAGPAIEAARAGVAWLPVAVELTEEASDKLALWNRTTAFLPSGGLPQTGEPLVLPGLAPLIEEFVRLGPELFWHDIGKLVADRLASAGGLLTAEDFRVRPAAWHEPDTIEAGAGARLHVTPAPTHGTRLAAAIRAVTVEGEAPLAAMRRAIEGAGGGAGTSVVAAGDGEGRGVVVVHSNSFPNYGSGVVVEELGLVLNNRAGRGFDIDAGPGHPNAPAPGRVPVATLHAWCLERGGDVVIGATPGGLNQAPWNLQTVLDLLAGAAPANVVTAPRWGLAADGGLIVEEDHPAAADLGGRTIPPLSHRSAEQLLAREGTGWRAAADPRIGAAARGMP